jgi:ribosome maturation factor RimP
MSEQNAIERRLHTLIDPIIADLKLDLYDLDYAGGVLKVTVDTPPGSPGGIDVDTLAQCTRLISRELDHSDPIPGHYTLEVSSPGLERSLRTPRHFQREVGKEVSVRLRNVEHGERRLNGVLVAADDLAATIRATGPGIETTDHRVEYDQIDRAKTVFVWEAAPKPGKAGGKKPRATADSGARKTAVKNSPTSKNTRNNDQEPSPS